MNEIKIDKNIFKALSVETRVKILKLLLKNNLTQTNIAENLKLTIPSIKEHLDYLVKSGLVDRLEEGRKWKYYQVTDKTKSLFNSEYYKFVITLGIFIISAGLSFIISLALLFIHNFKSGSKTSGKYLGNLIGLLFLATHT